MCIDVGIVLMYINVYADTKWRFSKVAPSATVGEKMYKIRTWCMFTTV
jgi:hypothetical protein